MKYREGGFGELAQFVGRMQVRRESQHGLCATRRSYEDDHPTQAMRMQGLHVECPTSEVRQL